MKSDFAYLFHSRIIRLKFSSVFYIYVRKNHYFDNKCNRWIGFACFRKLLLYRNSNFVTSNVNEVRMQESHSGLILFCAFSFGDSQDSMGRKGKTFIPLYHFCPLTNIQTFIRSFAYEMTSLY